MGAIRKGNRTVYAQWEDAGPFRTDHWQYVFGNEQPKPNLNKGAGLDVSPAVRDYLEMNYTDVTDWRFVEFSEVPRGPWSTHGENNTFVINDRKKVSSWPRNSSPVAGQLCVDLPGRKMRKRWPIFVFRSARLIALWSAFDFFTHLS